MFLRSCDRRRTDEADKLKVLSAGADDYSNSCRSRKFFTPPQPSPNPRSGTKKFTNDLGLLYICKPFVLAELAISIEVVLRRIRAVTSSRIVFDRFSASGSNTQRSHDQVNSRGI